MDTLRSVAHLQREIGDELFGALISSDNTDAVRQFARQLAEILPTTMTVGGRTYGILGFLEADEKSIKGDVMVARAKKLDANLGEDDGQHLLDHQDEIPVALRGKVVFVFTDWRRPDSGRVRYVCWGGDRWIRVWDWLGGDWLGGCRVLNRK